MIGATSLRTNNDRNVQSFGKSEQPKKSHTARNVAIAVGAVGTAAVGAYVFKGQLARIGFVKDLVKYAGKGVGKILDAGIAVRDFLKNAKPAEKIKTVVPELKDKIKGFDMKTVTNKAKEIVTTLKDKFKGVKVPTDLSKATQEAKDFGSKMIDKAKSMDVTKKAKEIGGQVIDKAKSTNITQEVKDLGKKVTDGVKKVKVENPTETVKQIKSDFIKKMADAIDKMANAKKSTGHIKEIIADVQKTAAETIEKLQTMRKR